MQKNDINRAEYKRDKYTYEPQAYTIPVVSPVLLTKTGTAPRWMYTLSLARILILAVWSVPHDPIRRREIVA
jgi:hypothetical protein